jgi:hypothetical protein
VDWIEDFLDYTSGLPSPKIFRQWAGIAALAGALERRVWVMSAGRPVYPNLYTLLVATPGVGKNVIQEAHNLWFQSKKFKVAPNSITKAGLVDALAEAGTTIVLSDDLIEYHTMLVASAEFGVLVPAHDLEFLSVLNYIFDNPPSYSERRRWVNGGKEIVIVNPQLNIIAGTQPGFLSALLPEEAWTMGTTSRLIMVYASEAVQVDLHLEEHGAVHEYTAKNKSHGQALIDRLSALFDIHGAFYWTPDAARAAKSWYDNKCPPQPGHSKLFHYIPRRFIHVLKLAMVSSASQNDKMIITLEDFDRAREWLLDAELKMPDIFREMTQRSDTQIIQEMHLFLWGLYSKKKEAIHESHLVDFLQARVPSEKVFRIIEVAEKANFLIREAGLNKMYRPRPLHARGVE